MFCNQCGTENRNDRKFCTNCGAKLHDYTKPKENLIMPEEIQQAQNTVQKRNYIKKLTSILLFIFFVFACSLTAVSFFVDGLVFWLVIGFALAFFVIMLIIVIVRHNMLKKLKTN